MAPTTAPLPHCGGNSTLLRPLPGQMGQQLGASSIEVRILSQRLPLAGERTKAENRLVYITAGFLFQSSILCARAGSHSTHLRSDRAPRRPGPHPARQTTRCSRQHVENMAGQKADPGGMVDRWFPAMRLWLAHTKADSHDVKCAHLHLLRRGKLARVRLRGLL